MMKFFFLVMIIGGYLSLQPIYAQEEKEIDVEQSAEVFLEEYSDDFQENFFEGLKQKAIQNYDRAVTYFMECKRLEPENRVITFELAKSHLLDKEPVTAQEYAIEAVNGNPENYWYAETLCDIILARKLVLEDVKDQIPWDNAVLKGNIADIFFKKGDYQTAKNILTGLKESAKYRKLENRILDSIAKQEIKKSPVSLSADTENNEELNGVEQYRAKINDLLNNEKEVQLILQISEEAMERFPTQPYFYFANGAALNRSEKYKNAIEMLEMALDFLIDDIPLENNIYRALGDAYAAINNLSKSNMYLNKIKPGF